MKKIPIILVLLVYSLSYSQNDLAYVDSLVDDFTAKLEERGINEYFYAKRYCLGQVEMFKMDDGKWCSSSGTYYAVYLFWSEGENYMIKKIDNCGMFFSLRLDDTNIREFYKERLSDLKNNQVKRYHSESWTGEPKQRTKIHSCYREFSFSEGNDNFKHKFALFDLSNDSEGKNVNFDYNKNLTIVQLDKMLDNAISAKEPKFKRLKLD